MNFYCEPCIRFSVRGYENSDALEEEAEEGGGDGGQFLSIIYLVPLAPPLLHPRHHSSFFLLAGSHPSQFSSTRNHPIRDFMEND